MPRNHRHALAAFTIAQLEPYFLRVWIEHYKQQVEPWDLFVLHHGAPGQESMAHDDEVEWYQLLGEARSLGVNIMPVRHAVAFDHDWLGKVVAEFLEFLLCSYEWVVFSEVDELVFPDPAHPEWQGYLGPYLEDHAPERPAYRARGYEVVQDLDKEGRFDRNDYRPLLAQRRFWYPCRQYSKTVLTRVPLRWGRGFHDLEGASLAFEAEPEPDLYLAHLHKLDLTIALERTASATRRRWNRADLKSGFGRQNRITDEQEMRAFFRTHVDTLTPLDSLEPIPQEVRNFI